MAQLGAPDIYRYAREAGFSPDQAVTMTAIALAESGGNTGAHNSSGEDSRGLWQINLDSHRNAPWAKGLDMGDPADNARAAFMVSREGADIRPWTVTHADKGSRYARHAEEAQAAAAANGEPSARGNFDGPTNYRDDPVPAGPDGADWAGATMRTMPSVPQGTDQDRPLVDAFLEAALRQAGDTYVFGAEAKATDADPDTFDCSELVEWAAAQAGISGVGDGSWNQYSTLKAKGLVVSVEEAKNTPGALLFRFDGEEDGSPSAGHVAISLGDGRTIEARGRQYGVGQWEVGNRFEYAVLLPGVDHGASRGASPLQPLLSNLPSLPPAEAQAAANRGGADTDADLLADHFEIRHKLDPNQADTDGDGITDGYELLVLGTKAALSDSDFDGLADDVELALGLDPTAFDNPDPMATLVVPDHLRVDSDGDGLSDAAEHMAGTNPDDIDSDDDGMLDADEVAFGRDPTDAGDGTGFGGDDGGADDDGFGPFGAQVAAADRASFADPD